MKDTRKAYYTWELPEEIVKAIAESKMDSKYDDLNELMDEGNNMKDGKTDL